MKKFLCILLSVLLTMSLWACSGDEDVRGEITTDPTDPQFSLGTTANNTYKNDYLGLSCTLPSNWVFFTDEEIRELNNIANEMAGEEFQEALEKAEIIYDMYASAQSGLYTVNVNLEKINILQAATVNLKTVLEGQTSALKTALENMGCSNIQIQYQKITVDGKEYDSLVITANIMGVPLYETLFCFIKGSYIANIGVCTLQTDDTAEILDCFTIS